jgi:hypothetical protein
MRELRPGLWYWQAAHPDWSSEEPWEREVSSYAIDDGGRLLLFEPLAVPNKLLELAAEREPAIVLTAPWHERDARALAERLNDVVLWIESHRAVVSGDTLADFGDGIAVQPEWLRKGVTREQVAGGLRPLLELPVGVVLPAHGAPTDRAALERALS